MKAFLFDLVNKLQRTSSALDAKAILCNKTWRVFSDTDDKEVYIFMEDGKLVISVNGIAVIGSWIYIPANQSLVISGNNQNYLVHPIVCNNILALIVDGTSQCAFLLDETQKELEAVNTLQDISSYISQLLEKIPQTNDKENDMVYTPTNLYQKEVDDYAFGMFGEQDGTNWNIDLRQLKRISGVFANTEFTCDFVDPSRTFNITACSSDCNHDVSNASFRIILTRGRLSSIEFNSKTKSGGWAKISISESTFLGMTMNYKKVVAFYEKDIIIDKAKWFGLYGGVLRKAIEKYKEDLTSVLGVTDILGLFEGYQVWY